MRHHPIFVIVVVVGLGIVVIVEVLTGVIEIDLDVVEAYFVVGSDAAVDLT